MASQDPLLPKNRKRRNSSQDDDPAGGKRKKARISVRKTAAPIIPELPLEIIFEILYFLQPLDLLRLARTSKDFRSLLMSRSSAFLWRRARANTDVRTPELPFDLSEPAYAHLLFFNFCHFCSTTRCEKVIWECRVRCCKKCFPSRFIPHTKLAIEKYYALDQEWHRISRIIPKATADHIKGTHLYLDAVEQCNAELFSLEGDANTIEKWFSSKVELYDTIKAHAIACVTWDSERKHRQLMERQIARDDRIQWIEQKAITDGWGFEVESMRSLGRKIAARASNHPSVSKKSKSALNHSDWVKIQPLVLGPLQLERSALFKRAMQRRLLLLEVAFNAHIETNGLRRTVFPSIGDLVTTDGPIKRLLETTPLDRNPAGLDPIFSVPSLSSTFDPAFSGPSLSATFSSTEFAEFVYRWKCDKESELLSILQEAVPDTSLGSDLCLATSVFKCNDRGCGQALYYPEVFHHRCATTYTFDADPASDGMKAPMTDTARSSGSLIVEGNIFDCCQMLLTKPWNDGRKRIGFHLLAAQLFRTILDNQPCFDPQTTTIQQIEDYEPTFYCKTCYWKVISWLELPGHHISGHDTMVIQWTTPSEKYESSAGPGSLSDSWVYGSRCALCGDLFHPNVLASHLLSHHNEIMADEHWYMDFGSHISL